jgi:hypothetical protein
MEKQKDTIVHYAKREGLEITRFVRVEISAARGIVERKLDFSDILICTETSRGLVELLQLLITYL